MNLKDNIIYNKNYIVFLPTSSINYKKSFEYTFKNVVVVDLLNNLNDVKEFINKNNFKQYIFVDFQLEYIDLIEFLYEKKKIIKFIYTKPLGSFSNEYHYSIFNYIIEMYKTKKIESIGFLDKNLYDTFKNKGINCYHVILDYPVIYNDKIEKTSDTIGILNSQDSSYHSFYNELSAIKLNNKYKGKILNISRDTKKFIKLFDIKCINCKTEDDLIKNNEVNLYVNFTENFEEYFFLSMDLNIPCILGNNSILDKSKKLYHMLSVKSDDNIDEICEKIDEVKKNKKEIIKEYKNFREKYIKDSKISVEDFLDIKLTEEIEEDCEKLLTIVVPVYNTEKYLDNCLKSILKALPKSIKEETEILVINDGSKDDSEKIALLYKDKYPNLIKYIKQENHGLGNVRNVALKNATGKYIASIDSDDTINKNFFIEALSSMKNNIDVIMYDWLSVTNESKFQTAAIEWCLNYLNKYEGILYTTIMPSTCNKIIKKSLYDELKINFVEDKYEDLSTNPFILLRAQTIKYINKSYYEYYIRSNSIMRSSAGYSMIDIIKEVDNRLKKYNYLINVDIEKFKYYTYSWRIEEFIFNQLYDLESDKIDEFVNKMYEIKDIICELFDSKYYKEMLCKLNIEDKKYIENRNKTFKEKNIIKFISKNKDKAFKLNAYTIYYGCKKEDN